MCYDIPLFNERLVLPPASTEYNAGGTDKNTYKRNRTAYLAMASDAWRESVRGLGAIMVRVFAAR